MSVWISDVTARQTSCGKVVISVMSVCPRGDSHVTVTHDALNLTLLEPPCLLPTVPLWTWGLSIQAPLSPFPGTGSWWLVRQVRLASIWYTSYWNAFVRTVFLASCVYVQRFSGKSFPVTATQSIHSFEANRLNKIQSEYLVELSDPPYNAIQLIIPLRKFWNQEAFVESISSHVSYGVSSSHLSVDTFMGDQRGRLHANWQS